MGRRGARNAPHLTGPAAPAGTPKEAPRHNRRGERRERRRGQEGGDGDLRRDVRGRGALAAGPAGEDGGGAGGGGHPHRGEEAARGAGAGSPVLRRAPAGAAAEAVPLRCPPWEGRGGEGGSAKP